MVLSDSRLAEERGVDRERVRRFLWPTTVVLLLALAAGTWLAAAERRMRTTRETLARLGFNQELLCVALAYHEFAGAHAGLSPKGLTDIEASKDSFPRVYAMIRDGEFIIRWNARLTADGVDNDKFILGYESKVPSEGGWVLLGGGGRMQMSKETFLATPLIPIK